MKNIKQKFQIITDELMEQIENHHHITDTVKKYIHVIMIEKFSVCG